MNPFSELRQQLADYLGAQLKDVRVVAEFPAAWGRLPQKQRQLAVGIERLELSGGSGQAEVTLRFDILCPAGRGGGCQAVFEQLCGALLYAQGRFGVCAVGCGEVEYRREWDMLLLRATSTLRGVVEWPREDTGALLEDLQIYHKERLEGQNEQIAK